MKEVCDKCGQPIDAENQLSVEEDSVDRLREELSETKRNLKEAITTIKRMRSIKITLRSKGYTDSPYPGFDY